MLLEHWLFPASICDVIRWQLNSEKIVEQASLLGSLQFTQRLLALTGLGFENEGWRFPETDPFVEASGLTPSLVVPLISKCRDDFCRILKSVDLS